jgi:hypothetical protein
VITVVAYTLAVVVLTFLAAWALLAADPDRYLDEPDDTDPDLLPRRLDEWATAVDRIKQDRGNR